MTDQDPYTLPEPPPYESAEYTKDWVRGAGENFIKNVIKEKLTSEMEAGHRSQVEQVLVTINTSAGNATRKTVLRDVIHNVLRMTPGVPPLSDDEHKELLRVTGLRIVSAYTAFALACKDERDAIKAEIAEDAEMMSLIFEIGFGFLAPFLGAQLGKAFEKGMTKIEGLAVNEGFKTAAKKILTEEHAKIAVESVAKVTLKGLKAQVPKVLGESEAGEFVKGLESKVREEGDKYNQELPNKTDVELTAIWATYAPENTSQDIYVKEISEQLEEFKGSVGMIGMQTSGGEFSFTTVTFAAYLETDKGKKLVLMYEQPFFDPWFLDWIPAGMTEMAIAKTKATHQSINTYKLSDITVPYDSKKRFNEGPR